MPRGGKREGAGRSKKDVCESKRIRVPFDTDVPLMLDCYHALLDAQANRSTARTHDALNKILDDIFGIE